MKNLLIFAALAVLVTFIISIEIRLERIEGRTEAKSFIGMNDYVSEPLGSTTMVWGTNEWETTSYASDYESETNETHQINEGKENEKGVIEFRNIRTQLKF